jgi:uncharacterized protein with FMN-binding domain
MKKVFIVSGIVVGVILIIGVVGYIVISQSAQQALSTLVYEDIDMARTADGTYESAVDAGVISVKVAVSVKDHAISRIDIIEHQSGKGEPAEAITQAMTAANTWDVDAVSGATLSSEAIKSAVSQALKASCAE